MTTIYKYERMDLTSIELRKDAFAKIGHSFLSALRENNFCIAPNAICHVCDNYIIVGVPSDDNPIGRMDINSEITLYSIADYGIYQRNECEISISSSGAFTPNNKGLYWKAFTLLVF